MVELFLLSHPGQGKPLGPKSLGVQVELYISVLLSYSSFEIAYGFTCFSHSDRIPHMTTPTRTSLSIIRPCHRVQIFSAVAFYQSFIRGVPSTHIRKDHYQILPPESMSNESIELHFLLSYISSSRTQFLACCYHTWGNLRLCGLSTC